MIVFQMKNTRLFEGTLTNPIQENDSAYSYLLRFAVIGIIERCNENMKIGNNYIVVIELEIFYKVSRKDILVY